MFLHIFVSLAVEHKGQIDVPRAGAADSVRSNSLASRSGHREWDIPLRLMAAAGAGGGPIVPLLLLLPPTLVPLPSRGIPPRPIPDDVLPRVLDDVVLDVLDDKEPERTMGGAMRPATEEMPPRPRVFGCKDKNTNS